MARNVFFSFDYEDVKNFKVNVIRNSGLLSQAGITFVDGSIWEEEKSKGDDAIKALINEGLKGTSVTAVLIGANTHARRWVKYEIIKSFHHGNAILGIHINRIAGRTGTTPRGRNPLERLGFSISDDGSKIRFYELNNRRWTECYDLPEINNKKSNTLYFKSSWWHGNQFGSFFKFSDKFPTYCWDFGDGFKSLGQWVEQAVSAQSRFASR